MLRHVDAHLIFTSGTLLIILVYLRLVCAYLVLTPEAYLYM
jgi:hypothetical protein